MVAVYICRARWGAATVGLEGSKGEGAAPPTPHSSGASSEGVDFPSGMDCLFSCASSHIVIESGNDICCAPTLPACFAVRFYPAHTYRAVTLVCDRLFSFDISWGEAGVALHTCPSAIIARDWRPARPGYFVRSHVFLVYSSRESSCVSRA